ncbi:MAG: tRNA (N6-threonylcarbamoyladenosine(37)-N6)-methyltransferase TrmO [Alphaproteobacteria bacterium]|nr:tRNA (N6-threonylcarbamoyladenosine(37)-N6)-methyltransferase TrmO [Alphaproteobacteria bacterium]
MHRPSKPAPPPRDHREAAPFPDTLTLQPIGRVVSPYTERHGTPRQPGQAGALGEVHLDPERIPLEALQDLAGMERIWLITWLHLNGPGWPARVRPPRGGPKRGLLATRAPHRPNPLGLSAVRLLGVEGHVLKVDGLDLIDGTPVLDIKPYVAFADAFPEASAGWVDALGGAPEVP